MRRNSEAGQTLVFVAFGMVIIGAILGLAIDMGYMRFLKRRIQTAADSAAIAGAAEIKYGDAATAAKADAASNGLTDGSNGVTVTVNTPPASGPHQGLSGYVEVVISKTQPTFFIRIVPGGAANSTVQARAVAGSAKNCIYTLQSSGTLSMNRGSTIDAPNCAIVDNGDLASQGTITASSISVGGPGIACSSCTPTPQQGIIQAADPLAYLQPPATAPCTTLPTISSGARQIFPGSYCAINVIGTATVTFQPGLYIVNGNGAPPIDCPGAPTSGLCIDTSGTVTGNGVTFYNTNNTSISIANTGTISLTAPTAGTYAGILLYQDRSDSNAATIRAANGPKFEGALYFPSATLSIHDIGSAAAYTIVVAGSLNAHNNNTFNSDYSSLSNVSPIREGVLVE